MEGVIKTYKLIVHENLGVVILHCKRKQQILASYASQKYNMTRKENNSILYIAQSIIDITSITEKSLMNYLIIKYKTYLCPISIADCIEKKIIALINVFPYQTEIECRRYINSNNILLHRVLGISCNDLSDMKYMERNIEIIVNDDDDLYYRCIININKGYSIQSKRNLKQKETFVNEIKSFELVHYNEESYAFDDSYYFLLDTDSKTIIGMASFLDSKNVSVKTKYMDDASGTVLYQRIMLDDYKKQQPFILEHEFTSPVNIKSLERYFDTSCVLNAKLCDNHNLIKNGYSNPSSKPVHLNTINETYQYKLLKLDGILANLKFYNQHFVITSNIKSESFVHSLPRNIIHRLKDFTFMIESELYDKRTFDNKKPLAIIDLYTTSFIAVERMNIIQEIKKVAAPYLLKYDIFFQDEMYYNSIIGRDNRFYPNLNLIMIPSKLKKYVRQNYIPFVKESKEDNISRINLQHGKIYEVYINSNYKIERIIKHRPDKIYPNSRKCIEGIVENLKK